MAPRPPVVAAVGAVLTLVAAGCGGSDPPVATVTPTRYVSEVEALLEPPAQLASSISERSSGATGPGPTRERLRDLVTSARERLRAFRALRLSDPALAAQRDRLAGAYARMLPRMDTAAHALAPGKDADPAVADGLASITARAGLATAAAPFLDALRALPSAAASPSSR